MKPYTKDLSRVLFTAFLLLLGSVSVQAQTPPGFPPGFGQTDPSLPPLTSAAVEKVIKSYGELIEEFKDYEPVGDGSNLGEYLQSQNAVGKAEKIMKKAGFENWQQWSVSFMQTMQAYAAYKTRQVNADYMPELKKQMAEIQNNPNISAAQKQQALAMMQASQGWMQAMNNISEKDIKAVEPHAAKLEALFEKQK